MAIILYCFFKKMNNAISCDEVAAVLRRNGVPRMFTRPGYSGLSDIKSRQASNTRVLLLDRVAGCSAAAPLVLELSGDGKTPTEIFYGAIRVLVLRYRFSVLASNPADLLSRIESYFDFLKTDKYHVLALSPLVEDDRTAGYLSRPELYRFERCIQDWLLSGRHLIFNGARPLKDSKMFSRGFINFLTSQDNYIFVPED